MHPRNQPLGCLPGSIAVSGCGGPKIEFGNVEESSFCTSGLTVDARHRLRFCPISEVQERLGDGVTHCSSRGSNDIRFARHFPTQPAGLVRVRYIHAKKYLFILTGPARASGPKALRTTLAQISSSPPSGCTGTPRRRQRVFRREKQASSTKPN
jgi:hypothetical protein